MITTLPKSEFGSLSAIKLFDAVNCIKNAFVFNVEKHSIVRMPVRSTDTIKMEENITNLKTSQVQVLCWTEEATLRENVLLEK